MSVFLLAIALAPLPPTCIADTPADVVDALHRDAYTFYVDAAEARPYVTDALHARIVRDGDCAQGEQCAISASPWTAMQDGDVVGTPVATVTAQSDTAAEVRLCYRLSFGEAAEDLCSTLALRTDARGCWAVDDLVAPGGESLRAIFEAYDYTP